MGNYPDNSLNERLAENVDQAFQELVKERGPALKRYIQNMPINPADVDDIFQDTWLKMYRWLKDASPETIREMNLLAYVQKIALNCVIGRWNQDQRRGGPTENLFFENGEEDGAKIENAQSGKFIGGDPEAAYLAKEQMQEVLEYLLPDKRLILRAYLTGWSYEEISKLSGKKVSTIKNVVQRSKDLLRVRFGSGKYQKETR